MKKKIQEAEGIVEAPYDARSLYERLQAEKDRKQEEYEATNALKNRVHRLDEDEVEYLQTLAAKQYKADLEKEKEANRSAYIPSTNITIDPNSRPFYNKGGSSQRALLANAVKRNSGSLDLIGPQPKRSNAKTPLSSEIDSEDHESFTKTKTDDQVDSNFSKSLNGSTRPVGVLPGLSEYSTSDSDQSTDSDDDESTDVEDAVCTLQQIACTRIRHAKTDGVADND
ncbi:NEFA-interacting nuclear protein NIP30 [Schistosoma japonicum]|nr:NEFA-interacting nuclear protein NIP30 [Schistosoma japonicum]